MKTLRLIKRVIRNLWVFIPAAIKFRPWDHAYVTDIFAVALKELKNDINRTEFYVGYDKDVKSMDRVLEIIKRDRDMTIYKENGDDYKKIDEQEEAEWNEAIDIIRDGYRGWWW